MLRRFVMAAVLGLGLLAGTGDTHADGKKKGPGAKANDGIITDWGKPKTFEPGKVTAFWLWYEDGIWHFRTTGRDKVPHRFSGRIEVVGGKLINLKGKKGEYGGTHVDRYVFSPSAIVFDFKTSEGVDGLNFAVDPGATGLRITVAIDGEAAPKHIRVGKAGDHPASAIFTTPAHPIDRPEPKRKKK